MPPGRPDNFPGIVSGSDLRTLGIAPETLDARLITRVTYANDGAGHAPDRFPSSWWAIEHGALLAALKAGFEAGGITMLPNTTVTGFAWHGGGIAGVRTGTAGQVIPADLVVLADESDPRLAEQLGLRPDWPPTALTHIGQGVLSGSGRNDSRAVRGRRPWLPDRCPPAGGVVGIARLRAGDPRPRCHCDCGHDAARRRNAPLAAYPGIPRRGRAFAGGPGGDGGTHPNPVLHRSGPGWRLRCPAPLSRRPCAGGE